jgi:diguanylate cyclase (GGDEF)-like protein/PAS domain S-box-containing protein
MGTGDLNQANNTGNLPYFYAPKLVATDSTQETSFAFAADSANQGEPSELLMKSGLTNQRNDSPPPAAQPAAASSYSPSKPQALHIPQPSEPLIGKLDDLARLATQFCAARYAIISLVEQERVIYTSYIGELLPLREQEFPLLIQTVIKSDLVEIADTLVDERFKNSSLVVDLGVRFLAAAPIVTEEGAAIGSISVLDSASKNLNHDQKKALKTLASALAAHLEADRQNLHLQVAREKVIKLESHLQKSSEMLRKAETEKEELAAVNTELMALANEKSEQIESLEDKEEIYSLVVNSSNDGLWNWDLGTNVITFCDRWKAIIGYAPDEIGNRPDEWLSRIHADDVEAVESDITGHLLGLTPQFQSEYRIRNHQGEYRWVLSRGRAIWDDNKRIYRMAGLMTDITEQKELEHQLLHNALHDSLTGLPNRTLFMNKLKRSLTRSQQQEDYFFAVLFLDLDRFKVINDTLGHQIGDSLLIKLARKLEHSVRPGDIVARLGGDEFGIIIENIASIDDASHTASRIQQELAHPFNLGGNEVFVSASIGISHSLLPYNSPEDFIRNADTAMYRAKDKGRGGYELFDLDMQAKESARVQLEVDLRRALAHQEFELHYQPIISLENWKITGFEALIRWNHPSQGFISPLRFIPIAEETGLVIKIGQWVIREACHQVKLWQQKFNGDPPLFMSINLSAKQFSDVNLISQINQIIAETQIDPGTLKIEITESAIIENIDMATDVINQLKTLGVKISLDDFGTGYSSLSYLHRFPIDTLKIDRSFVTRMNMPKNCEIVSTILTLANNLGLDVVAEGVETKEQILQLTGMKCDYVQGYLLSRPMDGVEMTKLIEDTYHKGISQTSINISDENIS